MFEILLLKKHYFVFHVESTLIFQWLCQIIVESMLEKMTVPAGKYGPSIHVHTHGKFHFIREE